MGQVSMYPSLSLYSTLTPSLNYNYIYPPPCFALVLLQWGLPPLGFYHYLGREASSTVDVPTSMLLHLRKTRSLSLFLKIHLSYRFVGTTFVSFLLLLLDLGVLAMGMI